MKYAFLVFVITFSSGCALKQIKYIEPTVGDIATITFQNNSMKNLGIAFYESSKDCKRRKNIDVILPGTEAAYKVAVKGELTFQYHLADMESSSAERQYCLMNLRFSPESGKTYTFETTEDFFSCRWKLHDTSDQKAPVPVKLQALPWKAGWDENSSFCKG